MIEDILEERAKTCGSFHNQAALSQGLKHVIRFAAKQRANLTFEQRESLDMIAHKIARILSGDPNHIDHWRDIEGYARLISMQLENIE